MGLDCLTTFTIINHHVWKSFLVAHMWCPTSPYNDDCYNYLYICFTIPFVDDFGTAAVVLRCASWRTNIQRGLNNDFFITLDAVWYCLICSGVKHHHISMASTPAMWLTMVYAKVLWKIRFQRWIFLMSQSCNQGFKVNQRPNPTPELRPQWWHVGLATRTVRCSLLHGCSPLRMSQFLSG